MSERFVILPPEGIFGNIATPTVERYVVRPDPSERTLDFAEAVDHYSYTRVPEPRKMQTVREPVEVIDEISGGGPKLIEIRDEDVDRVQLADPGGRRVPERIYRPAVAFGHALNEPSEAAVHPAVDFEILCARTGVPIPGADVTAITEPTRTEGAGGVTDSQGRVGLRLGPTPVEVAKLFVKPPLREWWGTSATELSIRRSHSVSLAPVDLTANPIDALRHFYKASATGADGIGVRVGVIDTGVAQHPDLVVSDGRNTAGEPKNLHEDNGVGHGTHVAGIIAGQVSTSNGMRGLAPEVELLSYRVYPQGSDEAGGFAVLRALVLAMEAECDLVNLSLETPEPDVMMEEAIEAAHSAGMAVIAAAGNGYRQAVSTPARYCVAVTALGRIATYPAGTLEEAYVDKPTGSEADNFLAGFSSWGSDVSLTAPGVGIVSTVPGGYGPGNGTSMAAAAATGMAARLLSAEPKILAMQRDARRSAAIRNLISAHANSMGLGIQAEGFGML